MLFNEPVGFKLNSKVHASLSSISYYPFHMHENIIELICVLNGSIKLSDCAIDYSLSYGDVYIFNANDPHKIYSEDAENIILSIQIDRDYYKHIFKDLELAYFVCNSLSQDNTYSTDVAYARFLMAKLYMEQIKKKPSDIYSEELARQLLTVLLNQFQYYTYKKSDGGSYSIVRRVNTNYNDQYFKRIYKIVDYIYANFKTKLRLNDLAAKEFLSVSHLSRYIREYSGLSFSELLSLARCEEAERILCTTNKTVDQISVEVGFFNRKQLAVQFKRWFQKTPTEYRKLILADLRNSAQIRFQPFNYNFAELILESYLNGY